MSDEIIDETRDIAAAVMAGRASVNAAERIAMAPVFGVDVPVAVQRDGTVQVLKDVIAHGEALLAAPVRRKLHVQLTEVVSFIDYVNRFKHKKRSAIYAESHTKRLTAVIDDFPEGQAEGLGGAAWREHRASYSCPLAPEWVLFKLAADKPLTQLAFGDFVEANMEYLTSAEGSPAPGDVLQMARSLVINTKGTFTRKVDRTTGTGTLICTTDHGDASTKIPRGFMLALRIFEGGEAYAVEARLRFAMEGNTPTFSFSLHRAAELELQAFADVKKMVSAATEVSLFAGSPG